MTKNTVLSVDENTVLSVNLSHPNNTGNAGRKSNAQLAGFKGQLNEVVTMTKAEMIQYLMSRYQVSYRIAQDALSDNDWDLMMAAGDIRDELNAEV